MKQSKSFSIIIILLLAIATVIPCNAQMRPGKYVIASHAKMEYVLAVPQSNYQNGQRLILWEYHSDYADQKFKLRHEHNNIFSIMPADNTRMLLAIPEGKIVENNNTILWQSTYGNEQYWKIENVRGMVYVIRSIINRDYVLSVSGTPGNDSGVVIQRYTGSANQQWVIMPTDGTFYLNYKNICDHKK